MDPARLQLLESLVASLPTPRGDDCVLVGIDGRDGAGKTTFANDLADVCRRQMPGRSIIRISIDDFHHTRAVRYARGRKSPEGFYFDSYDYAAFFSRVLTPLGRGGDRRFCPASHDLPSDRSLDPHEGQQHAPPGSLVIVDGIFLHRPELAGAWDYSMLLDVSAEVCAARMLKRDGHAPTLDPTDRYFGGQKLYFESCDPRSKATRVIDGSRERQVGGA